MTIKDITPAEKDAFNKVVSHPLQTYEWGEFRKSTGTKVIRKGFFDGEKLIDGLTMTLHPIPKTPWFIGYVPKGKLPDRHLMSVLQKIGKEEKCVFIQLEPNITSSQTENGKWKMENVDVRPAAHPLFTKYTFVLDLTQSEEELLKKMHPKARYNIRVAERHGVEIAEDNSEEGFAAFWKLTEETTKRQQFFAHGKSYHHKQWQILNVRNTKDNALTSHIFLAKYQGKVLAAWVLFVCKDALYYPYGASSTEHREVMASNLIMWEAIKFGKKLGLKEFDMWGAMGPNPDTKDPWFGFHNFKERYGPQHVEFMGSYDLVINPALYEVYKIADKIRWKLLSLKK